MGEEDYGNSFDRRVFLGASTATLLGLPGISLAQQQRPSEPHVGSEPATRAPSQAIADFATGFDIKSAANRHRARSDCIRRHRRGDARRQPIVAHRYRLRYHQA
jgi:hypothetical protein